MEYKIYTLSCPEKNSVVYVGMTAKPLKVRLQQHIKSTQNNINKLEWSSNLLKKGLKPIIEELETTNDYFEAQRFEKYWIHQFKQWGFELFNRRHFDRSFETKSKDDVQVTITLKRNKYNAILKKAYSKGVNIDWVLNDLIKTY